mmetsp:Transcript_12960/g.31750  ORF Transcript_12960/g.31750 Transcript_12960/m.31750 type:complete len:269 (+) Transcript_12960:167-973(+)
MLSSGQLPRSSWFADTQWCMGGVQWRGEVMGSIPAWYVLLHRCRAGAGFGDTFLLCLVFECLWLCVHNLCIVLLCHITFAGQASLHGPRRDAFNTKTRFTQDRKRRDLKADQPPHGSEVWSWRFFGGGVWRLMTLGVWSVSYGAWKLNEPCQGCWLQKALKGCLGLCGHCCVSVCVVWHATRGLVTRTALHVLSSGHQQRGPHALPAGQQSWPEATSMGWPPAFLTLPSHMHPVCNGVVIAVEGFTAKHLSATRERFVSWKVVAVAVC